MKIQVYESEFGQGIEPVGPRPSWWRRLAIRLFPNWWLKRQLKKHGLDWG